MNLEHRAWEAWRTRDAARVVAVIEEGLAELPGADAVLPEAADAALDALEAYAERRCSFDETILLAETAVDRGVRFGLVAWHVAHAIRYLRPREHGEPAGLARTGARAAEALTHIRDACETVRKLAQKAAA